MGLDERLAAVETRNERAREVVARRSEEVVTAVAEFAADAWEQMVREDMQRRPEAYAEVDLDDLRTKLNDLKRNATEVVRPVVESATPADPPDESLRGNHWGVNARDPHLSLPPRKVCDLLEPVIREVGVTPRVFSSPKDWSGTRVEAAVLEYSYALSDLAEVHGELVEARRQHQAASLTAEWDKLA